MDFTSTNNSNGKEFATNYAHLFMAKWAQEAFSKCPKQPAFKAISYQTPLTKSNACMIPCGISETIVAMQIAKASHFEHINEKLCSPDVGKRDYWHLLKSIYGCKIDTSISSIIDGDKIFSSVRSKAEVFNTHF